MKRFVANSDKPKTPPENSVGVFTMQKIVLRIVFWLNHQSRSLSLNVKAIVKIIAGIS
jgi:hypothetical protein